MNNRKKILIGCVALSLFAGTLTAHDLNQHLRNNFEKMKTVGRIHITIVEGLMSQLIYPLVCVGNDNLSSMTKKLIMKELTQLQKIKAMQQYTRLFEECVAGSIEHCNEILYFSFETKDLKNILTRICRLRSLDKHYGLLIDKTDNLLRSKVEADPSLKLKMDIASETIKRYECILEKLNKGIQIFDEEIATPKRTVKELDAIVNDIFRDISEDIKKIEIFFKAKIVSKND